MPTRPEISLVLPCYNEAENIAGVLQRSIEALGRLGQSWELIVVDNHSNDGTPGVVRKALVRESRGRLIVHEQNRMYAGSCRTALAEAQGAYVAIMDSDGQFTADDLPLFLAELERGANLVFGWRRVRHDPLGRKVMSMVFNHLARKRLGCPLHDLNVGLRMFDRSFVEVARLNHTLNLANPELYVRARLADLTVSEVPIQHFAREGGRSCHDVRKLWRVFQQVRAYFRALESELKAGPSDYSLSRTCEEAAAR